ncbi:MAG: APC family permease [Vicinamibacterales bacterium]
MSAGPRPTLRASLGFRDLLLFYIVTTFSLRWIAVAAAAGPSAFVVWIIAALGLFVPLVFATLELSSRYPVQGGVYVWSRELFGPFAGFITGWLYWCTNLPYFPSLLYFAAGNLLFAGGESWQALSSSRTYYIAFALTGLSVTVTMNVVGLQVGKWLNNLGAAASWLVMAALVTAGGLAAWRFGAATPMPAASFVPATGLTDILFWSTIAFAFGGVESGSSMAEEIREPRRTVPRAVLAAAIIIVALYLVGTLSVLVAVPSGQISGLQGIMQALQAVTARGGMSWVLPVLALLVVINSLGGVSGWFAAVGRLPFAAGLDSYLPAAFGRVHPRWGSPYVALLTQAAVSAVFVVLGQAGTSVRGAYDVLVAMSVITYFIPFLFIFAALVRAQRVDAAPQVQRVPGGAPVAIVLGVIGFVTTAVSIVLACLPPADDPNPALAIAKTVGLSLALTAAGAIVYALGRRRQRDA